MTDTRVREQQAEIENEKVIVEVEEKSTVFLLQLAAGLENPNCESSTSPVHLPTTSSMITSTSNRLDRCFLCRKWIGTRNVYMYMDHGFCSSECRDLQMKSDGQSNSTKDIRSPGGSKLRECR